MLEATGADTSSSSTLNNGAVLADPVAQPPGFEPAIMGLADLDVLPSLFIDNLLLDLLDPIGPQLDESLTFLERLCLEGDDPDSFRRQQFGN